ncbi:MAG: DUF1846 domain-containing protein [Clostridia bacterium]|nr:DUF1846 domain-containing protein [Clostridia bacterium]
MCKICFNNEKYVKMQSEKIKERISHYGKLYMEFGGKLFDDYHASRVLPGFMPDSKLKMLLQLKDDAELIIVISAYDILNNKVRSDLGISYDQDVLRLIDAFNSVDLSVNSVVVSQYNSEPDVDAFIKHLENLDIKVYKHYNIKGYPSNVDLIASEDGFGKNEYVETTKGLVVVTAPGPGSGKMATCLSQLYHENKRGIKAGYAKFETFPIWNLPLKHPVNLAYEAATADIDDVNMIDPFHLEAYGQLAVNYNRDVEVFPVLDALFRKIWGDSPYKSPTDMGVNMIGYCITDQDGAIKAAEQEIIRRYYSAKCKYLTNDADNENEIYKIELLLKQANVTTEKRPVIAAALKKAEESGVPATAIELADGRIITGKTSSLLGASAALLLNALKALAGIPDNQALISPSIIEPLQDLKINHLGNSNPRLHTDEILVALAICAVTSPTAQLALSQLEKLKDCEMHTSVLLANVDYITLKRLGIRLSSEPKYFTKRLYHPK